MVLLLLRSMETQKVKHLIGLIKTMANSFILHTVHMKMQEIDCDLTAIIQLRSKTEYHLCYGV